MAGTGGKYREIWKICSKDMETIRQGCGKLPREGWHVRAGKEVCFLSVLLFALFLILWSAYPFYGHAVCASAGMRSARQKAVSQESAGQESADQQSAGQQSAGQQPERQEPAGQEPGIGFSPDYTDIQQFLDQQDTGLSFSGMVEELISGGWSQIPKTLLSQGGQFLFSEIRRNKNELFYLFAIVVFSGIFTNFTKAFRSGYVAQTSFYVTCLLLTATLLGAFAAAAQITEQLLTVLLGFMKVLIPAFFLSVAYGGNTLASTGFYQTTLMAISGVEWIFLKVLLPFVRIYLVFSLVNGIVGEDLLSRLAKLVKQGAGWGMKTLCSAVLGLQMIQGMILPYVDNVRTGTVKKMAGLIPGVGKGISAVADILTGSGILIKNGIGTAAFFCLVFLSLVPLFKLAVISLIYQLAAALLAPVADKRVLGCVDAMAAAVGMLLKMTGMTVLLFGISIALVCMATNVK